VFGPVLGGLVGAAVAAGFDGAVVGAVVGAGLDGALVGAPVGAGLAGALVGAAVGAGACVGALAAAEELLPEAAVGCADAPELDDWADVDADVDVDVVLLALLDVLLLLLAADAPAGRLSTAGLLDPESLPTTRAMMLLTSAPAGAPPVPISVIVPTAW